MSKRRQFLGASLGSLVMARLALAQTAPADAHLAPSAAPLSTAERMNQLGPENEAMAAAVGRWDVTETVWAGPDSAPVTTTGLIAERRMIGAFLQEIIRPASDRAGRDAKRIDYLSFYRVEGRWKYVSIETRLPVGIMPAYSFDRGDANGVVLRHDAFAVTGDGPLVAGRMLRMETVITRESRDRDVKDQRFILADGDGTEWLAHRYAYQRRA